MSTTTNEMDPAATGNSDPQPELSAGKASDRELDLATKIEAAKLDFEKYKFKHDTWRFHVGYCLKWTALYFAIVGGIFTIMFTNPFTAKYVLSALFGGYGCIWIAFNLLPNHKEAVIRLAHEMDLLAQNAKTPGPDSQPYPNGEGEAYLKSFAFMQTGVIFTLIVFATILVLAVLGSPWLPG